VATRKKFSQKGVEELKAEMAKPRAAKSAQRRLVLIDNFEGTDAAYARADRMAATYHGAWIVLLVVVIYGPVLVGALADPSTAVKSRGAQLLRRHHSIWRSNSFAGPRHDGNPPAFS
jgi:hypothetical protein